VKLSKIDVVFYCDERGRAPFLDWFDELPSKAQDKCTVRIERLRELGHELRRPEADYLRDGIYELRIKCQSVNYRILYFFHGQTRVILSHGISKQQASVPNKEINEAMDRKRHYQASPELHTYNGE